jgi:hypothetical protein
MMESTVIYRDVTGNPIPWPPPLDIRLANISTSKTACKIGNGDHLCLLASVHDGEHQCYACKGYWGK